MAHFEKECMVKEVSESLKDSSGVIITNFTKLDVVALNSLRRSLEKNSARLIVTKNSLFKLAMSKAKLDQVSQFIKGQTGVAICKDDPISVTKTLVKFSKDHEDFKVRGGMVEGQLVTQDRVKELSELPSKDILRAMVVMQLKSPITGLINVLAGSIRGLVLVLSQITKQKKD